MVFENLGLFLINIMINGRLSMLAGNLNEIYGNMLKY